MENEKSSIIKKLAVAVAFVAAVAGVAKVVSDLREENQTPHRELPTAQLHHISQNQIS